ncbi:MAG: DUF4870 domain-containing protein [Deltaproteobacteria bacterium]|nr:DUF4870 domain-containing protein [Deltaproteobacteria bacterium]
MAPAPFRTAMDSAIASQTLQNSEDRTHAAAAHLLGAFVGLITAGVLFPVAAPTLVLVINSSRNPFVLFHVNQAAWFQALLSSIQIVATIVFFVLYFVTCGVGVILLVPFIPLFLVGWALSVLYPAYIAYQAYQGQWALYPYLGTWVLDQESPLVAD